MTLEALRNILIGGFGLVASIGTVFAFGSRWIVRPILHALDERNEDQIETFLAPVLEKLSDIEVDVADIRHEVNANNGRSLKDVAMQTRGDVQTLTARFEDHLAAHDPHTGGTP